MYQVSQYNDAAVKDICYNCGSPTAKQSYNYFRRANYRAGQAKSVVWCKVFYDDDNPIGLYYAYKCRNHVRLIEIAVRADHKRQGIGKMMLYDLLTRMRNDGVYKLTFRSPSKEDAPEFWMHMGARIMDVKGDDYEMELTIKQE